MKHGQIRFGVHYEYPFGGMARRKEWLPEGPADWRRDLVAIRETGFDIIRIRIGQDTDLDEVAELLDIAQETNLDVLFGFATFFVPYWFIEQHPDSRTVDRDGGTLANERFDDRWPRVCIHHPAYRAARDALIEACAARFTAHPSVVAWDIHNEPDLGHGGYPCYCPNTIAAYRQAVAGEFGSIDSFDGTFGQSFPSFNTIEPPRRVEEAPAFWRHWREFLLADLSRFLNDARNIVKEHDASAPVTYNIDPVSPWMVQQMVVDWWNSRELDFATCSHYANSDETSASSAINLAILKAIAPERDAWITEFAGGNAYGFSLFKRIWTGNDLELEINSAISHGMLGLIIYRWEPIVSGQETGMMALTEAGNYDTERRRAVQRTIGRIRGIEPLIMGAKPRPARVGIYLRRHQLHHAEEHRQLVDEIRGPVFESVRGHYAIWTELGYETSAVVDDPRDVPPPVLVVFPYLYEAQDLDAVLAVLAAGDHAVVELPARDEVASRRVAAAFGLELQAVESPGRFHPVTGWNLVSAEPGTPIVTYGYDSRALIVEPVGDDVLLRYGDTGGPAALRPAAFDGRLLVLTFAAGLGYDRLRHPGIKETLGSFAAGFLRTDLRVDGVPREIASLVETRLLEGDAGAVAFVINRSSYSLDLMIEVDGYDVQRVPAAAHAVAHVPLAASAVPGKRTD
jgi:hypothetical protein